VEITELGPAETGLAHLAMLELRPNVGTEAEFVARVNDLQRPEGYRLVGRFVDGEAQAVAAAGFRTSHFLAWGYALYVDDLSSRPGFRRQGHSGVLLDWLLAEARRLGCGQLHLDSGVGPDREEAHRLYLNKRLRISAHHFQLEV
jgi:GNAT superfamily N-acetyltransferase